MGGRGGGRRSVPQCGVYDIFSSESFPHGRSILLVGTVDHLKVAAPH